MTKETYYEIVTASSMDSLKAKVREHLEDGWTPVGGHQVVAKYAQNVYAGSQHRHTVFTIEYSQTMITG